MNEANVQKPQMNDISLFKQKNFLFLWIGTFFSGLSISMFYFSEAWYVVQVLNLEASLGIIYIVGTFPRIIFMLIGGVLSDKINQSKIMFISDLTKAIFIGGLVILLLLAGEIHLWTLVIFALLIGILDAFFWPASSSIIPAIVSKSSLTRANSVIQTTNQTTSIFGPMIGGLIIVGLNYTGIFGIIALLLLLGSIFVLFVNVKKTVEKDNKHQLFGSLIQGIGYVKNERILMAFVLKTLFLNLFFTGPLVVGLPIFVKNVLGGGTLDYSYVEAFLAGGMLVGSIMLGAINLRRKRGTVSLTAQMFMAICFIMLSFSREIWQSVIIVTLLGLSMTISNICAVSVIQNKTDPEMIGRVMSIQTISSIGLTPISYGITSLCLSFGTGIQFVIMFGALFLFLFTFLIYFKIPTLRNVD